MTGSTKRAGRRAKATRRARTAAVAGAAATALTVGLTGAPSANSAIQVNVDINPAYTAGAIASLINFVGTTFPGNSVGGIYNSGPPQTIDYRIVFPYTAVGLVPLVLDVDLSLGLKNIRPTDTQYLYNTIAAIPQSNTSVGNIGCGGDRGLAGGDSNPNTSCRTVFMLGTSEATLNLANAYSAEISAVTTGQSPAGYIPFEATTGSTAAKPTQTNQALAFLQNPLRPNGGFLARFPGLSQFLGQDPTMPAAGLYKSPDETITVNTTTVDATWAYDPTGDFPAVFNIFSVLNSLNAILPINLAGGLSTTQPYVLAKQNGTPALIDDIGLALATMFQVRVAPIPVQFVNQYFLTMEPGQAFYATIVPKDLPIFSYMKLPALAINAALGALNAPFRVGTPWSDALAGAMKILVNVGYDDVVTPQMIADDPATYGGYQPYDRTFLNSGVATPFGSVQPLTAAEKAAVPRDVFEALLAGFRAQFAKPLFGYIVPAPSSSPSSAPAVASRTVAAVDEAPSETVVPDVPVADPASAAVPKPGSVRPSRGKAERADASSVRKPAASKAAPGDGSIAKPAAAASAKQRVSR